jgi:uncharacterized membrane protein
MLRLDAPLSRLLLALFYGAAGVLHLVTPAGFVAIVPSLVPWPATVVLVTGLIEIVAAIALLVHRTRRLAGWTLAAYAIAVFPANVHHALAGIAVAGLPTSWWYHGPRLALQPLLVWWALRAGGVIGPMEGRRGRSGSRAAR